MANTYAATTTKTATRDVWTFDAAGSGTEVDHRGGPATLGLDSSLSLGGGSLQWEWSPDWGTSWCNIGTGIVDTATPAQHLLVAPGSIRPTITGGAAITAVAFKV